jgi:sulfide dehydrogenase [flavocytochrome c] flavoprotein chain
MSKFSISRREFIRLSGLGLSGLILPPQLYAMGRKPPLGHVVVIGGGFAGATVAKYLRLWSLHNIRVTVIEKSSQFVSCPLSNLVLGGSKNINDLTFGFELLKKNHGIQWVQDEVTAIYPESKKVIVKRGEISYDRLIIAPGVDMIYDNLPGMATHQAQEAIPHAWKAGWQTVNLRKQLEAMPDGGVFAMHIPKAPYRCPPGPYERACQVASYFKVNKPSAKVIVLDANPEITSKKGLFTKAFSELYPGIIEYRPNNAINDIDVASRSITTDFDKIDASVLNIIPPQRAGKAAQMAGLNNIDKRWCEVDFLTYESKVVPDIHVIGDSVSAGLPKSAHMATSQARVCANAILALQAGQEPDPAPVFANTCYSYVNDKMAMHVANVYRYDPAKKIMVSADGGGVSDHPSEQEGQFAGAWADNIWSDVLT